MLLENKNITVVGMGVTGIASAKFLVSKKARVTLIDSKPQAKLKQDICSLNPQIRTLFECSQIPLNSELIVISPGVNINSPFLEKANKQGVPVISEIELASRFTQTPIIAVTGTNGKSTVTTLIGDILKKAGRRVAVGGNLGRPFIDLLEVEPVDYFILEVSTFQLEGIKSFQPNIAIILNITPDHLDRHKNFKEYSDLKGKISAFQSAEDTLILNKDDEHVLKQAINSKAKKVFFSMTQKVTKGICLKEKFITTCFNEKEKHFLSVDELRPPLKFQIENILGAIAVTSLLNVTKDDVANVVTNFKGLDHRIELVRTVHGIDFINDSKGTNLGALHKSLENFSSPIILIAGGKDKGGDFQTLKIPFKEKVKHLVLIGETKGKFREVLNGLFSYEDAENMEDAVMRAMKKAKSGDIVLLSPGCSSFDMFIDFNDRGNQFKKIVSRL
jgi:UDP-N-acetylmuramoylalanine--D-glutamate ligase